MGMKWVENFPGAGDALLTCRQLPGVAIQPGKILATVLIEDDHGCWEEVSALPLEEAKAMAKLIYSWSPTVPSEEVIRAAYLRAGGKLYTATQVVELLRQHQESGGAEIPMIPFFPHMGEEDTVAIWVTRLVVGNYHTLKTEFSVFSPLNAAEMGATVEKDSGGTPYLSFQGERVVYECQERTINSFCR